MSKRQARIGGGILEVLVGLLVGGVCLSWGKGRLVGSILRYVRKKKRLESEHLNEDVRRDGFTVVFGGVDYGDGGDKRAVRWC
jgi:hypothetical protein